MAKRTLIFCIFALTLSSFSALAQDQEGNLQMPVTDISEIQKEEAELPPTIDEVPMYEDKKDDGKVIVEESKRVERKYIQKKND